MSGGEDKPGPKARSRARLGLTMFAGLMVVAAVLIGAPAAATGSDSILLWLDVGFCLVLAAVLFVIGLKGCRSRPDRERPAVQLRRSRDLALVLAAVVAILGPALQGVVDIGRSLFGPLAQEQVCPAPPEPPADVPPA